MRSSSFVVHLYTRAFCVALGKELTALRTVRLPVAPYPGLGISFGKAPVFQVHHVQLNHDDGSFTVLERNTDHFAATAAAVEEWAEGWRSVGFEVDEVRPDKPPPSHLKLVT